MSHTLRIAGLQDSDITAEYLRANGWKRRHHGYIRHITIWSHDNYPRVTIDLVRGVFWYARYFGEQMNVRTVRQLEGALQL